ncbi:MAG: hypothetical protein IVW54_16920 [Candidatus Binataceae bacterium]|nr:hypothetical protein [Candidatus Binataceae bacterium]
MQNVTRTIAIGILAALVVALIAVAIFVPHERAFLLTQVAPFVGLFGAVTVTYEYPVAGTAAQTPAAAAAAGFHNGYNTVRGTVIAALDADTTATISHGLGLSATAIAAGQPELTLVPTDVAFYTSTWTAAYTDLNTITLTKGTGGGSGAAGVQLRFIVRRPSSIGI